MWQVLCVIKRNDGGFLLKLRLQGIFEVVQKLETKEEREEGSAGGRGEEKKGEEGKKDN